MGSDFKERNRSSPSRANNDFVMATKGNHLLPLQQNQKYYSYVQTNADTRPAPNEDLQSSKIGSYIQTTKSKLRGNFISNNLDRVDAARLHTISNELHSQRPGGSASRSRSRSHSNQRAGQAVDSPGGEERNQHHYIAPDSLEAELRKERRRSPHYQGLRQMPSATDSRATNSIHYSYPTASAPSQFENRPRTTSSNQDLAKHVANNGIQGSHPDRMTLQELHRNGTGDASGGHMIYPKEEYKRIGEGCSYRN